jgi:hypothetical protein
MAMSTERNYAKGDEADVLRELFKACGKGDVSAVEYSLEEIKLKKYNINALIEIKSGDKVLSRIPAFFALGMLNLDIDNDTPEQLSAIRGNKSALIFAKKEIAKILISFPGFDPNNYEVRKDGTTRIFAEFLQGNEKNLKKFLGEDGFAEMMQIEREFIPQRKWTASIFPPRLMKRALSAEADEKEKFIKEELEKNYIIKEEREPTSPKRDSKEENKEEKFTDKIEPRDRTPKTLKKTEEDLSFGLEKGDLKKLSKSLEKISKERK